jgi:hypothetical protein
MFSNYISMDCKCADKTVCGFEDKYGTVCDAIICIKCNLNTYCIDCMCVSGLDCCPDCCCSECE